MVCLFIMHIIDTTWDLRQKISQRVAHPWKFYHKNHFSRETSNTYMHTYIHIYHISVSGIIGKAICSKSTIGIILNCDEI